LFAGLRCLAALIMVTTFGSGIGLADEWMAYRMGEVTFEAPADWKVARRQKDRAFVLQNPKRDLELRVEWWFQDEPILGYDDIKSHKRIAVAGKPATLIHSAFPNRQTLKAVLDEKRPDGRKLLLVLESTATGLSAISPLFDDLLARVGFGKSSASPDRPAVSNRAVQEQAKQQEPGQKPIGAVGAKGATPGQRQTPLSPQMRAVAGHVADDCEAVALATWNHPTLEVIRKRKQAHLEWVMLCRNRSYPVYGTNFDYDPQGRTSDFFNPLYDEMLSQNRDAPFSFAALRDKLIIDVTRPARDGVSVDIREVPDLDDAPADRGAAATPPGVEAKPGSRQVTAPTEPRLRQEGWTTHRLSGFTLAIPPGWTGTVRRRDDDFSAASPQGERSFMAWWWLPDEPLLGFPDIVSHRKVTVAGRPALRIHTKTGSRETLSVTFDRARADGKRLRLMLEAEAPLGRGDADFEAVLARLEFTEAAPKPRSDAPAAPAARARAPERRAAGAAASPAQPYLPAPEDEEVRVWLGPVSFEPPSGWQLRPDDSGRLMAMVRPDPGAEILVILWPAERPMPGTGIGRIEHVVIAGAPATRLRERSGRIDIDHIFFDEPFADGSRLSVAYRATGEPLEDGAPLLEIVLASLDRRRPAPAGPTLWMSSGSTRAVDPFANLDTSELQSRK
jgi:hypothetical protein